MGHSNELNKGDSRFISEDVSPLDDIRKGVHFLSILHREESSGRGDCQGAGHVSGSDGLFRSTLLESEVCLSEEHVVCKIEVVFLVESVELLDQEVKVELLFVEMEAVQPPFSGLGGSGKGDVSFVEPVLSSGVD